MATPHQVLTASERARAEPRRRGIASDGARRGSAALRPDRGSGRRCRGDPDPGAEGGEDNDQADAPGPVHGPGHGSTTSSAGRRGLRRAVVGWTRKGSRSSRSAITALTPPRTRSVRLRCRPCRPPSGSSCVMEPRVLRTGRTGTGANVPPTAAFGLRVATVPAAPPRRWPDRRTASAELVGIIVRCTGWGGWVRGPCGCHSAREAHQRGSILSGPRSRRARPTSEASPGRACMFTPRAAPRCRRATAAAWGAAPPRQATPTRSSSRICGWALCAVATLLRMNSRVSSTSSGWVSGLAASPSLVAVSKMALVASPARTVGTVVCRGGQEQQGGVLGLPRVR